MRKLSCSLIFAALIVSGCAPQGVNPADYAQDARYIGRTYKVMKDHAYMGVRDRIQDGQTLKVVETFRSPQGLLLVKVADDGGGIISDTPYTLDDLGLIDEEENPIQTSVDQAKVKKGVLGIQKHGYGDKLAGVDHSYTSNVEVTRMDGLTAHGEPQLQGLGAICVNGRVWLSVAQSQIIGAPGSDASYDIYVDDNVPQSVAAKMTTYEALSSLPPDSLVSQLLSGKRGTMRITTISQVIRLNFELDGFAEMYTRVKNNCEA